jgi:O-antigen/teichoic acid export membrane protein
MRHIREFLRRLLPQKGFARNVSLLAGGTALSQMLSVMAAPVLTRLYPVEDFGYFQVYLSVMMFAGLAVTLRCEQAIFLPERDEIAANVLAAALCAVGFMSLVFACAALLIQRSQFLPRSAEGLRSYIWLIPVGACGAGTYQSLSVWGLRQKAYSRISGTKVTQVASALGTQTALGALHPGPLGLLLGDIVGRTAGSLGLARLAWRRSCDVFRLVRAGTIWNAVVRYRRFPLISSTAGLVGVAATALPPLLIAQLYGARTLGWFALSDRVLGAPSLLIGQAISQVYSVEASTRNMSSPQAVHRLFLKCVKQLLLLGLIPFALFLIFSPLVFAFVFGSSWREAGVYARLLALMHYIAFVSWPLTPTLNILERQFWQLAWDVGRLVFTLGAMWLAYYSGWSARGAVAAFGAAMLLGYVTHLLLSHHAILKRMQRDGIGGNIERIPAAQQVS